MRKINSIGYGHKILGSAAILLVFMPLGCYLFSTITKQTLFFLLAKISFILGFAVLLFLFILLKIEFLQDKKIAEYFEANKHTRVALKNGLYECQACGNKQVKQEQKSCDICGVNFLPATKNRSRVLSDKSLLNKK